MVYKYIYFIHLTHLYSSIVLVKVETASILAKRQTVSAHKLRLSLQVHFPLRAHSGYLDNPAKIHLQPLVDVHDCCHPAAGFPAFADSVQAHAVRGSHAGRGGDGRVWYLAILQAERSITCRGTGFVFVYKISNEIMCIRYKSYI